MSVEVESDLPNLKITFGNDDSLSEGEIDDTDEELPKRLDFTEKTSNPKVSVERKLTSLESFRKYENKGGAFITGIDLGSEDIKKKLTERAARFGIENSESKLVTQEEIDSLYKNLEIDSERGKNIRFDALHVRGVDDMSTSDVIGYFKQYGPASVEWINDTSCNVIWFEDIGAARALLGLSQPYNAKGKEKASSEHLLSKDPIKDKSDPEEGNKQEKMEQEEIVFMSESSSDEEEEDDDDKFIDYKHRKAENKPPTDSLVPMEVEPSEKKASHSDDPEVDIPVPPGQWRLGIPHEKSKVILIRFATKDDKKLPGAERRSQYYQKYGNPNYGGLKGLISKTRKRKFNVTRQKDALKQLSSKDDSSKSDKTDTFDTSESFPKRTSAKRFRMQMRADEEEERIKRRQERKISERKLNVHARLGQAKKMRRRSDDEGDRRTYDRSEPTNKLSRFNVWTELAHSMARESGYSESNRRSKEKSRGSHSSHSGDLRQKLQSLRQKNKSESLVITFSGSESDSDF